MPATAELLKQLQSHANAKNLKGMARFGMTVEKRLGIPIPVLRQIAKKTGQDHKAARGLWKSGIAEARILASMIAVPGELTSDELEAWVRDLDSWDVCDQVCMNLFEKTPLARQKIGEWSVRDEEYVKRAAFALLACLAWHDKQAPDAEFIEFLPVIQRGATDERNYVKKAVSWALRNIGKRNVALNQAAIRTARTLERMDSRSARWIAADALRELEGEPAQKRLARKSAPPRSRVRSKPGAH